MPNSLYRMLFVYLFLACVFCYSCPFLFVVFCLFVFLFCSHWSSVDVPLIFFCPADHVPDWQSRILLGMVEARSVNVKKTTILHFFVAAQTIFPLVRLQQVFKHKGQCIIYCTDSARACKMGEPTRGGRAEPFSRDQKLRRERGQKLEDRRFCTKNYKEKKSIC